MPDEFDALSKVVERRIFRLRGIDGVMFLCMFDKLVRHVKAHERDRVLAVKDLRAINVVVERALARALSYS